jgi:enoyl-CoA hydratase
MAEYSGTDVLFSVQAGIGRITLNRPKALNALNHGMIRAIASHLEDWAGNPSVRLILMEGAGERGFCAGGDIRSLYEDARHGRRQGAAIFFRDEYLLNARIARYGKPVVAFMDGIVMGGGIGLSAHAAHRVVTERSQLAMPETGIGFIPDVGGTYLLARAPGELGLHMALTAGRIGAADAILCGLADVCVAPERLADLATALEDCQDDAAIDSVLQAYAQTPPAGVLGDARNWIDSAYAADTTEQILQALQHSTEPGAQIAAREIAGKSPTSLKVALRLLRAARRHGRLEPCLQQEYDAAMVCVAGHDFVEGVRAAVVDKDRAPKWSPPNLSEVTDEMVDRYFGSTPETDLHLI